MTAMPAKWSTLCKKLDILNARETAGKFTLRLVGLFPRPSDAAIAAGLVAVFSGLYSLLAVYRHWHFESMAWDLGIFSQAIWHYSRLEAPMSTLRQLNIMGDHFSPILVLLAPVYRIFPSPVMLVVAQAILFSSAIIPVYIFARKRLDVLTTALVSVAFGLFWGLQIAALFDFHEVAFAVPLVAWSILFLTLGALRPFLVCCGLLLLTKEDLAFYVAACGLYIILFGQQFPYRKWVGGGLVALGAIYYFTLTSWLLPAISGVKYQYWTYKSLGSTPGQALVTMIAHPTRPLQVAVNAYSKRTLLQFLFLPTLLLPLASPLVVLAVPFIAERVLSDRLSLSNTYIFHYSATIAPVLFMATADSLARITAYLRRPSERLLSGWLVGMGLVTAACYMTFAYSYPLHGIFHRGNFSLTASDRQGRTMLAMIPPDSSVAAETTVAPHLANRAAIYDLIEFGTHGAEYVAFKLQSSYAGDLNVCAYHSRLKALHGSGYGLIYSAGPWALYKRNTADTVQASPQIAGFLANEPSSEDCTHPIWVK